MWLLAWRNLGVRPGRTALFLVGFALAVGVLIALLSVGDAIVGQAREADLVGGGDLVLVPEGTDVEVLELGGVTAMFAAIPNARFVHRQLLGGPRYADAIAAASPSWSGRPLYLRRGPGAPVVLGSASAGIPSLERATGAAGTLPAAWADSPGEAAFARSEGDALLDGLDRWHRPDPAHPDRARWAEWQYFHVQDPASGRFAYLSFLVAGDPHADGALGGLSIQLGAPGRALVRHSFRVPVDAAALDSTGATARFAGGRDSATVRFERGAWRLRAAFRDREWGEDVRLALDVTASPRAFLSPLVLRGADGFESGYVVPALLGRAQGTIDVGGSETRFENALAYHDHNWGTWRRVTWDWGHVQSADGRFAVLHAAVHGPALAASRPFVVVASEEGFLGLLRPDSVAYSDAWDGPRVEGTRVRVPGRIRYAAIAGEDTLSVEVAVTDVTASVPEASAERAGDRVFLQVRGPWTVRGRVAGRPLSFTAVGAAETFVPFTVGPLTASRAGVAQPSAPAP